MKAHQKSEAIVCWLTAASLPLTACNWDPKWPFGPDPPLEPDTTAGGEQSGAGTSSAVANAGSNAAGSGGAAGTPPEGFVAPELPDCSWQGSLCDNAKTLVCDEGRLVEEQDCLVFGCLNETQCTPPGSAGAVAESSAGLKATPSEGCDVFEGGPCPSCLNNECCIAASECMSNASCKALWSCLSACHDFECEATCASRFPAGVSRANALVSCADSRCRVCKFDPCELAGYDYDYYCGKSLSPAADPNALYLCNAQTAAGAVLCDEGCHVGGIGEHDYCNDIDPCANNPYNGFACGSNLATPAADPNVLYECKYQKTVSVTTCVICLPGPPGTADTCL